MDANFSFDQNFDSDDENQQRFEGSGRDACVFVIDCSASMFAEFEEDEVTSSAFLKCLSVLERLMSNRIVSNYHDLLGVVFYNTEKSPEPSGSFQSDNLPVVPKGCAVLLPMRQVESDAIQLVKNLKNSADFLDFDNKFGHSKDAKISDVLLLCSSIFSSCEKKIRVSTVMWYTNEDLPHQVGSSDHQQAFRKAKDLQQLQLELQFFPMKLDFDGDLFYKELICQLNDFDLEDYQFPVPQMNEKILLQRMFRRGCSKRALSHLTVDFSDKLKFGVGIYSFTRKSQLPKSILLSRQTKEQISSKRSYKYATVGEDEYQDIGSFDNLEAELDFKEKLEPSKMIKYQQVGGERIRFTPLEAYEIKQLMDPAIKVLGFKPSSVMSEIKHLRCPYFIYPNETRIKNSTVLFRTLWERCLADDKVVICIFTMRLKSFPRLVALIPQSQSFGPDGEILRYDGFRLEFIPYAGDVRDLSEVLVESEETDENLSSAMAKIIKKLKVNYTPSMLSNPAINNIYALIEKEVYNEDVNDELLTDDIMPNVELQDGRIAEGLSIIEESIGLEEIVEVTKRKAKDPVEANQSKKVATNDIVDMELVRQSCINGNLKDVTIPKLKSYLKAKNVTGISTLTKTELVAKIIELS